MENSVFVLRIADTDVDEVFVYGSFDKAVHAVVEDLHDVYHFDPLITPKELHDKMASARETLVKWGKWTDDDTTYMIDERQVE